MAMTPEELRVAAKAARDWKGDDPGWWALDAEGNPLILERAVAYLLEGEVVHC